MTILKLTYFDTLKVLELVEHKDLIFSNYLPPEKQSEIPRFYFPTDNNDLAQHMKKIWFARQIERVEAILLNNVDLKVIWDSLFASSRVVPNIDGNFISYADFRNVGKGLPEKMQWLFKPEIFLQLPKTDDGCISIKMLNSYITRAGTVPLSRPSKSKLTYQ